MTRRVFKYDVQPVDEFTVSIPVGATVLSVQAQGHEVKMWAEVDDANEEMNVKFYVVGTGHAIPDEARTFIGTFQMYGGGLVFHLYRGESVWPC